jgi:3-oxoacyl-[acyl-carrier-protein] synthase II
MKTHSRRRVVITGMGLVSPAGSDVEGFWRSLVSGESSLSRLPDNVGSQLAVCAAATVDEFSLDKTHPSFLKRPRGRLPLFVEYALAAAAEAMRDAALDPRSSDPGRLGVVMGNGAGGFPYIGPHLEALRQRGPGRVDPQVLTQMIPNVVVGHMANAFGARGYNNTIVAACASGTQALGEAARAIREGLADVVLAGGTEAWITEVGLVSFSVLGALSNWQGDPAGASRPFDKDRSGFVPAEGAAVLVIEERESALERGATVLAELAGYASTNDAFHLVAPDPEGRGAAECIRLALENARASPADVDYVNAHGTATVRGDISETRALRLALGRYAETVPISATKSMIGHGMGASGALEVVAVVQTVRSGVIHPTINLDTPDPECDLDYVPHSARKAVVTTVLKNSFGFGGHNACLVIRRHDE